MCRSVVILLLTAFVLSLPTISFGQFRKDTGNPNISGMIAAPATDILFGLLDPSKMNMRHSVSMSYGTMAGNGMALSSYMNMIDYHFSENLILRANIGIMTSPYNSYGENFYLNKPRFFGGAELHYKFSDNSSLHFQIQSSPYSYNYYRPMFSEYNNPFQ